MIKSIIAGLIIAGLISIVIFVGLLYLLQYINDIGLLEITGSKETIITLFSLSSVIYATVFYAVVSSDYKRYKAVKLINELENVEKEEALKELLKKHKDIAEKYDIKV